MSERKLTQPLKKDPYKWGFIIIDKEFNGTIAMYSKDKIKMNEHVKFQHGWFHFIKGKEQKEEIKRKGIEAILKKAVELLISRETGKMRVDGILVHKSPSTVLEGPLYNKLEPNIKMVFHFEAALENYLEYAIKRTKKDREPYEQELNKHIRENSQELDVNVQHQITNGTNKEQKYLSDPSPDEHSTDPEEEYIPTEGPFNQQREGNVPAYSDVEANQVSILTSTSDDHESTRKPKTKFTPPHIPTSSIPTEDPRAAPEEEQVLQNRNIMEQASAGHPPSTTVPPLSSFSKPATNDPPHSNTTNQSIISTKTCNSSKLTVPFTQSVASSHTDSELKKEIKQLKQEKEELISKVTEQEKIIETLVPQNKKIPPTVNVQQQESPVTEITCNIVPPPPQVSSLHQQIIQGLKEKLSDEGLHLLQGKNGPSIVIAVNNSRLAADVKRDLGKTGLKDVPILLLIIKTTRNENENPTVRIRDLKDDRIKEACFFLVDLDFSTIHTCQLNHESFQSVSKYLKTFEIHS